MMEAAVESNPSSKFGRQPIEINSISIDLNDAAEKLQNPKKCEHFTLRGCVAEARKKDWTLCWPFPLPNKTSNTSEEERPNFPPLRVPEFRRWNCESCLQEIGAISSGADLEVILMSSNRGFESKGTGANLSSQVGNGMSSDSHQAPDSDIEERIEIDLNKSLTVESSKNLSSSSDNSNKEAGVAEITITGQENGLQPDVLAIPTSASTEAVEVDSPVIQAMQDKTEVPDVSKCSGSGYRNGDAADVDLNSAEFDQLEKQTSADNQDMELTPAQPTPVIDGMHDQGLVKGHSTRMPSMEIDDSEDEFSESHNSARSGNHDDESSSSLQRRKSRKMRFLADLLRENVDPNAKRMRVENPAISQRSSKSRNRKRKLSKDEEWKPSEASFQTNTNSRTVQGGVEIGDAIESSKLVDANVQSGTFNDVKSHCTDHTHKKLISDKKKKKKKRMPQSLDADRSLIPCQESFQKAQEGIGEGSRVNNADNGLSGQGAYGSPMPTLKSKRNIISWDKGKKHQAEDELVSVVPAKDGILRAINYKETSKTEFPTIPIQVRENSAAEQGLGLSLDSRLGSHGFSRKVFNPIEDGRSSSWTWKEGTSKDDQAKGKDVVTGYTIHPCVSPKSAQDAYFGQRMAHYDDNSKRSTYRVPNLNDSESFEVEHGRRLPIQPLDFPGASNNAKFVEAQKHLSSRFGDQRGNRISEQGVIDDVPMDIVELMAKNQYERCLPDASNNKPFLNTTSEARNVFVLPGETTRKQKIPAKSGRNGLAVTVKTSDLFPRIGHNVHTMSTAKQNTPPWFNTYPRHMDWPSSGFEFSGSSSSRPNSNQNLKWNAEIVGQASKHANLQAAEVHKTGPGFPQRGEEVVPWPSRMPNHMPLRYNTPQKCASQPKSVDMRSNPSWHKGNSMLNLNVPVPESGSRSFPTEAYGRTQANNAQPSKHNTIDLNQSPMGAQLDLNSKETISAMQLLSLMDAGMRSGPSFNPDNLPKFLKKPSRPQVGSSHEFSTPPNVINKMSNSVNPSLSDIPGMHYHSKRSNGYYPSVPAAEASASTQRKYNGSSNLKMLPLPSGSETRGTSGSATSSKRVSEYETCAINRNPADFTMPGPDNEYMIRAEDLNFGSIVPSKNKSRQRNTSHSSSGRGSSKIKSP